MADIKLFNIKGNVKEYQIGTVTLEKELQTVIENNMTPFFGVTFLASDFGNLKERVLICLGAVVIAVFHGVCSSFTFRYFHYTKWEKQKKLCGEAFT